LQKSPIRRAHIQSIKLLFALSFLLLFAIPSYTQALTDTLSHVQNLRGAGQYGEAGKLMENWLKNNTATAETLWLYADIEYHRKNYNNSRRIYEQAISMDRVNLYLQLDYAEKLLYMGHIRMAGNLLKSLPEKDRNDIYAIALSARHLYWSGDVKNAYEKAKLAIEGGYEGAEALLLEIKAVRAPWLASRFDYTSDTQPLQKSNLTIQAGYRHSRWFNPELTAAPQWFETPDEPVKASLFSISNRLHLSSALEIDVNAGSFSLGNHRSEFIGGASIKVNAPGGFSILNTYSKEPYLYTLSSLESPVTFNRYAGELEWQERHGFWLKGGIYHDTYEDENHIQSLWAWFLSPSINTGIIAWRGGYAFSISGAEESRFVSAKTPEEILETWETGQQIEGIYSPYFTPNEMLTHAVLLNVEVNIAENAGLSFNGKYGIFATANNPYLFGDLDEENMFFINRDFQKVNFTPFEFSAKGSFQITTRLHSEIEYRFTRILFYDMQYAGLALKYRFL